MQKHISLAENTPTAHIFYHQTIDMNSQHPHLLGFDSNLIANFNILLFQPYLGEDSKYSEQSERFSHTSASPLGNNPNNRKFIRLVLFFTGYSRVHCKYQIHRLFAGFGVNNPNTRGESPKGAVKWQKLSYQYRKFPKIWNNHCIVCANREN